MNEISVGPYSKEIRTDYMNYRVARYMIDHPQATKGYARKQARLRWRRKVINAVGKNA